ncbi:hypothetical protein BH20ACT5_BH20ACT5_23460 [soil metagenome]
MATTTSPHDPTLAPPVEPAVEPPRGGPTDWSGHPQVSLGELVKDASTHLSALVHAEIELAKTEITGSLKKGVTGVAFFGAAGVVAVFSLVFLLISLAEGLVQLGLYRWLSYLIVWFLLIVIAGIAALIGWRKVKTVRKPERTIETLKDNKSLIKRGSS